MAAHVNGMAVPCHIPAAHVLLYFPSGVLGLQHVICHGSPLTASSATAHAAGASAGGGGGGDGGGHHEAVFLQPDGSLKLEDGGKYYLPASRFSPPGGGGAGGFAALLTDHRQVEHVVDTAVSRVGQHMSSLLLDGRPASASHARRISGGADLRPGSGHGGGGGHGGSALGRLRSHSGHARNTSGSTVIELEDDDHRAPSRQPSRDADEELAHNNTAGTARSNNEVEHFGRSILFERTNELVPAETDEKAAARFATERRRSLLLYLAAHVLIVGTWAAAIGVDRWLQCSESRLGVWSICYNGAVNATLRGTSDTRLFTLANCVRPQNFAGCDGPNFSTVANMLSVSTAMVVVNVIIIIVDLSCHITPRRPFYPFYFLVLWSMTFATWMLMAVGANSPAGRSSSQLACGVHENIVTAYFDKVHIVVYHPLESERWSTQRMEEVGVVGSGIANFATDCTVLSVSLLLCTCSWIVFTIIGGYYFYSRYSAWNDITSHNMNASQAAITTTDPRDLVRRRASALRRHRSNNGLSVSTTRNNNSNSSSADGGAPNAASPPAPLEGAPPAMARYMIGDEAAAAVAVRRGESPPNLAAAASDFTDEVLDAPSISPAASSPPARAPPLSADPSISFTDIAPHSPKERSAVVKPRPEPEAAIASSPSTSSPSVAVASSRLSTRRPLTIVSAAPSGNDTTASSPSVPRGRHTTVGRLISPARDVV